MSVASGVRHFLLALQFFTRIPVTGRLAQWVGYSPAMLQASAAYFPAVGVLVGAWGALVFGAALAAWPAPVAAMLCMVATVLLTGAFHEDGLADVADGLGGSSQRERALEIMKDSRIGAFGAIALVLALGLKAALLVALTLQGAGPACVAVLAAHVLSRLAPLGVMRALPYVGGDGGKAKPMAHALSLPALGIALCWSLPVAVLLVAVHGIGHGVTALLGAAVVTVLMAARFRRRLGGFTGDCLGATQQVAELAIYLALAARL
ncbi:adenosylcobinamide-GDP ribazoletransferase [Variovorax ginsengisoli]|uniref:Adenosylcobinamide-GDP ribazoletransferase n=1 Tax=Variovorax ginsengisoli TaxID=363844 RepID=A0ABT9SEX0_9BURK|nr:adenosylcobinamide-GDP ribazoletransferase [Variovorax ginsengisoli]MDP9902908.1 adenosylcobinamide-GDP ribazoletransferase [Variovorax ginsengisoli]